MSRIESEANYKIAKATVRKDLVNSWPNHPLVNRGPLTLGLKNIILDAKLNFNESKVSEVARKLDTEDKLDQQIALVLRSADEFMKIRKSAFVTGNNNATLGRVLSFTVDTSERKVLNHSIITYESSSRINTEGYNGENLSRGLAKLFTRMSEQSDFRIKAPVMEQITDFLNPLKEKQWIPSEVDRSWDRHINPVFRIDCDKAEGIGLEIGTAFHPKFGWTAQINFTQKPTEALAKERKIYRRERTLSILEEFSEPKEIVGYVKKDRDINPKSKNIHLYTNLNAGFSGKIDGRVLNSRLRKIGYERVTDKKILKKYKGLDNVNNLKEIMLFVPIDKSSNNHLLEVCPKGYPETGSHYVDIIAHHTKRKKKID